MFSREDAMRLIFLFILKPPIQSCVTCKGFYTLVTYASKIFKDVEKAGKPGHLGGMDAARYIEKLDKELSTLGTEILIRKIQANPASF